MVWLFAIVAVLMLGGVAVVAAGRGGEMAPTYDDRPDVLLPSDRALSAADLRAVRFTVGVRGYRASEVDALLARLADEMSRTSPAPVPTDGPEGRDQDAAPPADHS